MKTHVGAFLVAFLGCSSVETTPPRLDAGGAGGSDGGTCSLSDCPTPLDVCKLPSCESDACVLVNAPFGLLCWGQADDKIRGRCDDGECDITEWGCTNDGFCDDANECTSDACEVPKLKCLHDNYPRTHLCQATGHCNPVDGSCCEAGFVEDRNAADGLRCVRACPFGKAPRILDGLCVVP